MFSTRPARVLEKWFEKWGLRDLVDKFPKEKPPAVAYVDDRGFRFNGDFQEILTQLQVRGTEPWWMPREKKE